MPPGGPTLMCLRRLTVLIALAIAACAPSPSREEAPLESPAPPAKSTAKLPPQPAPTLEIGAVAIEIRPTKLRNLRYLGAVKLSSPHKRFGGFSGLEIANGTMLAINDNGWLLRGQVSGDTIVPKQPSLIPMRDGAGKRLRGKAAADAEALALDGDRLWIAFERDHRIMGVGADNWMTSRIQPNAFERLRSNSGIEALAALPDGRLLAIAERKRSGDTPFYVIDKAGKVSQGTLPRTSRHSVTGADIGPDGLLYLVLRHYSPLWGVSGRLIRMGLGADGLPDATTSEDLAVFTSSSGIDNMEGISLWTDPAGRTRLTLISDDNYSGLQRTILVDFAVE